MLRFTTFTLILKCVLSAESEVVVLRAVRGRDARLPCGRGKVFLDGPDSYVLWLKNERDFLYRFPNEDTETRSLNQDRIFGVSCDSGSCHDDTSLLLKRISEQDRGQYRCRVHYQASPSVDYVIDLRLVDSPGTPRIYNEDGDEIKKGYVGPLSLQSDLTLICEVDNVRPETLVYWRRNGAVIERAHTARPSVLRAEVRLRNLSRSELDAHYECLAQNADVTEPLAASLVVRMYLPPLSVEIRLNNNYDFEAGQPRVVDCVVVGCVPPPSVTWHLGDTLLRPSVHKELHDGNYTVSSLTLAPSLGDSKHELVCRAHNSHLPTDVFEDKVLLNVGYRPVCLTRREETLGAVVREAETVTCVVEASPEPLQFSWTFADSKTLYTSVTKVAGYHHRYSSTLTWLSREGDIGLLLCRATNAFGEQKRPCSYTISPGGPPLTPDCVVLRSYPNTLRVQCKKSWDGGRPQTVHLEILDEEGTPLHNVSDPAGHFQLSDVEEGRNLTAVVYATNIRGRSEKKTVHLQTIKPLIASGINSISTAGAVAGPARHNTRLIGNLPFSDTAAPATLQPITDDVIINIIMAVTESFSAHSWTRWLEVGAGIVALGVVVAATALCVRVLKARRDHSELNPDLVPRSDGSFHREPDFAREERLLGTTNITVNQLASCQNQYSSPPVPSCRVVVGCAPRAAQDSCPTGHHSYYV